MVIASASQGVQGAARPIHETKDYGRGCYRKGKKMQPVPGKVTRLASVQQHPYAAHRRGWDGMRTQCSKEDTCKDERQHWHSC